MRRHACQNLSPGVHVFRPDKLQCTSLFVRLEDVGQNWIRSGPRNSLTNWPVELCWVVIYLGLFYLSILLLWNHFHILFFINFIQYYLFILRYSSLYTFLIRVKSGFDELIRKVDRRRIGQNMETIVKKKKMSLFLLLRHLVESFNNFKINKSNIYLID